MALAATPDLEQLLPLKPAVAAAALALLWVIEGIAPEFIGRRGRGAHFLRNVALGVLNGLVVSVLFASLILAASEWARQRGFGLWHVLDWPWWVEWPAAIVAFDLWMYAWHVMNHRVPLLWRFHAVHHTDEDLDASSALRFHTGEIILSSIARLAVLPLLGMTIEQLVAYELILLPIILLHHSNVHMPRGLDRVLRCVIVTPWVHWVHHSRLQPETDSNYASVFSWWDRIFGTFRLRRDPREIELGLDGFERRQWATLSGMLMTPFRSRGRRSS